MWSLIDRTNIGVARISGIDEKLGLNISNRASVASKYSCWAPPRLDDPATEITEYTLTLDDNQALIVYLGYAIVELPSNIALRKFGAANWISFLCLGWGFLTFGIGFSKSYSDLVIMRAFLGAFEGVSIFSFSRKRLSKTDTGPTGIGSRFAVPACLVV